MKYVDIPKFGQLVEYITQAEPIQINGEMVAGVVINQVDLSEQPIIKAAESIKADYEMVSTLRAIPKLTADKVEKIKLKIEQAYCLDVAAYSTLSDEPLAILNLVIEVKSKADWKLGVVYTVGTVVLYLKNLYRCIANHTSTLLTAPDKDKNKWAKFYEVVVPVAEPWAVGVVYAIDTMVLYKTKYFKCLQNHTSTALLAPDTAKLYWVEIK